MRYVWEHEEGVISRDAHQHLIGLADEKVHRSRASVIFFLKDMAKRGFLLEIGKLGQGGGLVWFPSPDFPCEEAYMREMAMQMVKAAGDILNVTFMVKQTPVA